MRESRPGELCVVSLHDEGARAAGTLDRGGGTSAANRGRGATGVRRQVAYAMAAKRGGGAAWVRRQLCDGGGARAAGRRQRERSAGVIPSQCYSVDF